MLAVALLARLNLPLYVDAPPKEYLFFLKVDKRLTAFCLLIARRALPHNCAPVRTASIAWPAPGKRAFAALRATTYPAWRASPAGTDRLRVTRPERVTRPDPEFGGVIKLVTGIFLGNIPWHFLAYFSRAFVPYKYPCPGVLVSYFRT